MSETKTKDFNPYHKWLGIPPEEQPPNHYRLLGVVAFESDVEVIENAADQRMALLKTFGTSEHASLSQKLMNEVSAAKVNLLNAGKKKAYDEQLNKEVETKRKEDDKNRVKESGSERKSPPPTKQAPAPRPLPSASGVGLIDDNMLAAAGMQTAVAPIPAAPAPYAAGPMATLQPSWQVKKKPAWLWPVVGGGAAVLIGAVVLIVILMGGDEGDRAENDKTKTPIRPIGPGPWPIGPGPGPIGPGPINPNNNGNNTNPGGNNHPSGTNGGNNTIPGTTPGSNPVGPPAVPTIVFGGAASSLKTEEDEIKGVAIAAGGRYLVAATNRALYVWDLQTGKLERREEVNSFYGSCGASPDGDVVFGGYGNMTAWNRTGGEPLWQDAEHVSRNGMAVSPTGEYVAVAGTGNSAVAYNAKGGGIARSYMGHTAQPGSFSFSRDGAKMLSGSSNEICLWDVTGGTELKRVNIESRRGTASALAPTAQFAAVAAENAVQLFDVDTGLPAWKFPGSNAEITSLAYSGDGWFILAGAKDGGVLLIDATTGKLVRRFLHGGETAAVAMTSDARYGASVGAGGEVKLFDLGTSGDRAPDPQIVVLKPKDAPFVSKMLDVKFENHINDAGFDGVGKAVYVGSPDKSVGRWDVETGNRSANFAKANDNVLRVAPSHDGDYVAVLSDALEVFRANGSQLWNKSVGDTNQSALAWSPKGDVLAVSLGGSGGVGLYKCDNGAQSRQLAGNDRPIRGLSFSQDGKLLLGGGSGMFLWDVTSGQKSATFNNEGDVQVVALSPDGRLAASGENPRLEGVTKVWDVASGTSIWEFNHGVFKSPQGLAFSPDGGYLAVIDEGGKLRVFDAAIGGQPLVELACKDRPRFLKFSPKGDRLITGGNGDAFELWSFSTSPGGEVPSGGGLVKTLEGHARPVHALRFTADGRLFSGGADRSVRVWNTGTGRQTQSHERDIKQPVRYLDVLPNAKMLVLGTAFLDYWDLEGNNRALLKVGPGAARAVAITGEDGFNGRIAVGGSSKATDRNNKLIGLYGTFALREGSEPDKICTGHQDEVTALRFTADGTQLLSGSLDGTVRLWDAKTGASIRDFAGEHQGGANDVALSADGRRAASGGNDKIVRFWDVDSGEELWSFDGHQDEVTCVAISADGRFVISGSNDKSLRVLSTTDGKEVANFDHGERVNCVACAPTGRIFASGGFDNKIKLWSLGE